MMKHFGPMLVAQELVEDRFGTLSRAWERDAKGDIQALFLRQFAPELAVPAVTAALRHSLTTVSLPSACGSGHRLGLEPSPHWKADHRKSRSIRRIQEKCREEAFPLELSMCLHVAWTLAHVCARFWRAGYSVGPLSLDSIRVDFEGALFLPDLGWLPTLIRLADEDPAIRAALPDLPHGPVAGQLQDEALRFGTFLYEMITFQSLPSGLTPAEAISQAQHWTPTGPNPLPEEVREGLARLLGDGEPYESLEGALKEFEEIVFAGEDENGPSTFNLAHLMHTIFRQDFQRQQEQLETELAELGTKAAWSAEPAPAVLPVPARRRHLPRILIAAALLAAAGIAAGTFAYIRNQARSKQRLEAELVHMETAYAELAKQPDPLQEPGQPATQANPQPAQAEPPAAARPQAPAPRAKPEPVKKPLQARYEPPRPLPAPPERHDPVPSQPPPVAPVIHDHPAQVVAQGRFSWPQDAPRAPVVVRVFIQGDGRPLRATPFEGGSAKPAVVQAAMDAAMNSTYTPSIRDGKPVSAWVEVKFTP
jgi:hypothetical protein